MKTVYLNIAPGLGLQKIFVSLTVSGNPDTRKIIRAGQSVISRMKMKDIQKITSVHSELNKMRVIKDIGIIK
jgi:hypothetical protein